jgi:chemotaxis protein CheZ
MMDDTAVLAPRAAGAASPEVFRQLGQITRQLHDTLTELGVMPNLRRAADGLPDARSRLGYIAAKTGEAADKVLNSVDSAKLEHSSIAAATRRIAAAITADPVRAVASGAVLNFVGDVEAATQRIDRHLTDIMMAQDFHDLTGQVVAKVVSLAGDLEDSLVKLLLQAAPAEHAAHIEANELNGPVHGNEARGDIVADQGEVDELLASLGF